MIIEFVSLFLSMIIHLLSSFWISLYVDTDILGIYSQTKEDRIAGNFGEHYFWIMCNL